MYVEREGHDCEDMSTRAERDGRAIALPGRRRLLAATLCGIPLPAMAAKAPAQGLRRGVGEVLVDGRRVKRGTIVSPGMTIVTGRDGQAMFVIGRNAFLLREESRIQLLGRAERRLFTGLRIITGALLSVFEPGPRRLVTPTLTMGIRGTGVYLEARDGVTYACTCYGAVQIDSANARESLNVLARHHSAHRVYLPAKDGPTIVPAAMQGHSDEELGMLEALVGRRPPFMREP